MIHKMFKKRDLLCIVLLALIILQMNMELSEAAKDKEKAKEKGDKPKTEKSKPKSKTKDKTKEKSKAKAKKPKVPECTQDEKKWEEVNACIKTFMTDTEKYDFKEFNIVGRTWKKICKDNYVPLSVCYKKNIGPCPHLYARYRTELRHQAAILDRIKDKCEKGKNPKDNPLPQQQTYKKQDESPMLRRRRWQTEPCSDHYIRAYDMDMCTRRFTNRLKKSDNKTAMCERFFEMKKCHMEQSIWCDSLKQKIERWKDDPRGPYAGMDHIQCSSSPYDTDHKQWRRKFEPKWDIEPIVPATFSWENSGWLIFWSTLAAIPVLFVVTYCYFWPRKKHIEEFLVPVKCSD